MGKTAELLKQWREVSDRELQQAFDDARKELFNLRFRNATRQLDRTSELERVRRNIARLKTLMRERELVAEEEG